MCCLSNRRGPSGNAHHQQLGPRVATRDLGTLEDCSAYVGLYVDVKRERRTEGRVGPRYRDKSAEQPSTAIAHQRLPTVDGQLRAGMGDGLLASV